MSGANGLELELKLEADPATLEALAAAAVLADAGFVDRAQHSTYHDTPDLALRAAGFSLRVRRTGDRHVQTVKAEGTASAGLFARAEWERDLVDEHPVLDDTSGPIATLLPALAPHALATTFTVDVRRRIATVKHEGAEIEVVIDTGTIEGANASEPVAEAELELKRGDPAALFSLARAMNAAVPLRVGVRSKSERGYALHEAERRDKAVKALPGVLAGEMRAGEAFARIAAACVRQFRLNEAILLRTGNADALHQARVAIRRLRSALSIFKPIVGDARFEPIRGELRWLAATLGEARDIDVLLARSDGEVAETLRDARERAYADVVTALGSQRARTLMIDIAEWVALGVWRIGQDVASLRDRPADRFAADALENLRRRIKRRGADLAALSDEDRHDVRILAKKLRYASEFFRGLFTSKRSRRRVDTFLDALEALQEELGELNDLAHGPEVLARLGIDSAAAVPLPQRRRRLIDRAAEAQEVLVDAKRFWR